MERNELFLKTAFCFMACDGNIANDEVEFIKKYISTNADIFKNVDTERGINKYIDEINQQGQSFLSKYLQEIAKSNLTESDELELIKLAISIIEADSKIEYSEISFFKRMRSKLNISDEAILLECPNKENYLLPDIDDCELEWLTFSFDNICLS